MPYQKRFYWWLDTPSIGHSILTMPRLHIKQLLWGPTPTTEQEAKLLLKIDWFILSYCCSMVSISAWLGTRQLKGIQYFTNCWWQIFDSQGQSAELELSQDLDRSNVNNAYVSGMKEELNMLGTELNVRSSLNLIQGCRRNNKNQNLFVSRE